LAYAQAKHIDVNSIPVIDVGPLMADDPEGLARVAREIRAASEAIGFFYIRNHGVDAALIERVFAASRAFFALPEAEKRKVAINARHRGFLGVGQAKMYTGANIDLKESYLWGLELGEDDPDVRTGKKLMGPNNWPSFCPEMRPALYAYYEAVLACGRRLLRAIAASLDRPADFFERPFAKPLARGSLVYYPPQPPDMSEQQFGVAPHTDYGGITLLSQDLTGGLQVLSRAGDWVTAHPIADTFVINIGDLMARWTNGRFRSNPHRVVNSSGRARYSVAIFFDPHPDTLIDPRDLLDDKSAAKYPPITCGDYVVERFDKAFKYREKS
jgi:isopenicillin N synthase-like dioxygenase